MQKMLVYRFPKDTKRLGAWLNSLGIGEVPKDHERICDNHFLETDFEVKDSGRRFVKPYALPSKHGYRAAYKSYSGDHNYAENMNKEDVQYPPEIMMLLAFSLLLFLDFCLTVPRSFSITN